MYVDANNQAGAGIEFKENRATPVLGMNRAPFQHDAILQEICSRISSKTAA
jgi:hypothetical protein